jgi:hypothetical protein
VGPRSEKAEATRARLVEVAGELFGERGYEDTPIEDVLERTGVSKSITTSLPRRPCSRRCTEPASRRAWRR